MFKKLAYIEHLDDYAIEKLDLDEDNIFKIHYFPQKYQSLLDHGIIINRLPCLDVGIDLIGFEFGVLSRTYLPEKDWPEIPGVNVIKIDEDPHSTVALSYITDATKESEEFAQVFLGLNTRYFSCIISQLMSYDYYVAIDPGQTILDTKVKFISKE